MNILGRKISDHTASIISSVLESEECSIQWKDANELSDTIGYGAMDFLQSANGTYVVYLRRKQTQEQFETTVLHELRHVYQMCHAFPIICNKVASSVYTQDPEFFRKLGAHIQSAILDMDVINWLNDKGYRSDIFSNIKDKNDLLAPFSTVTATSLKDNYNRASAVLHLYVGYVRANPDGKELLLSYANEYRQLFEEMQTMNEHIISEKCSDPKYCAYLMGWIIERYNMWCVYYVNYLKRKIRVFPEFVKFFDLQ